MSVTGDTPSFGEDIANRQPPRANRQATIPSAGTGKRGFVLRRVVPVVVQLLLTLIARAQVREWLPLEDALERARASERLVLLHLRAGTKADQAVDQWLAEAVGHDAIAHSVDEMVLARCEYRAPVIAHYEEIRVIAKRREPHLAVLDPGGGVLVELYTQGDFGVLAAALSSLRGESEAFIDSARQRAAGHAGQAYFIRAIGLGQAGAVAEARRAFAFGAKAAETEHDKILAQHVEVGLAALDLNGRARPGHDPLRDLYKIAEHALTPTIAGDAWLLIGDTRRAAGDSRRALEAFTSAWQAAPPGSKLAEAARHKLEAMGAPLPNDDMPSPAASSGRVHLVFPRRPVMVGSVDVVATAPEATARVEFLLDEARVTESSRRPYRARLPLGSLPRVHTLRAVAYDERNRRLGDEAVTINEHVERLSVEIVAPKSDEVERRAEVEVVPHVPDGDVLDAVDVFWNETKLATLTAAPFRTSLTLPSRRAFGYIRAVARTKAGVTAEDAKLLNSASVVDSAHVEAVEVYAIVQDREGHNVEGLTAADFDVREDGQHVDVALRGSPGDPITVGLALDTSGSMQAAMMDVAEDARIFLRDSLAAGDQTLLVAFDAEPHLVQPLTADREHVSAAIFDASARGATAVWDAIAFSLAQLKAVTGKRALLVFTDGADNGSKVTPDAVRALAREAGAPVYIVLMYTTAFGNSSRSVDIRDRRFAEYGKLAKESGGAMFVMPKQRDLPQLFARVRDDTRGEYILSFVTKSTRRRGEPRALRIDVQRRGVVVRAPSAYVPR